MPFNKKINRPESSAAEAGGHAPVPAARGEGGLSPVARLCVVGMLCAAGIAGRLALWTVPNIQPVTAVIIFIAAYIGLGDALLSSAVICVVTNLLMGSIGMWTLYQTAGWMLVALLTRLIVRAFGTNHWLLLGWAFVSGFVYGFTVDIISWKMFLPETSTMGFWTYKSTSILFDLYHALGNAVFVHFLDPLFVRMLKKAE